MSKPLHIDQFAVGLSDTDAAGRIYFARLLERAHEAYEAFLRSVHLPIETWIADGPQLPIVHAEADFLASMTLGQELRVSLMVYKLGRTSFTLDYRFLGTDGDLLATARTVHVALSNGEPVPLPERLREVLL